MVVIMSGLTVIEAEEIDAFDPEATVIAPEDTDPRRLLRRQHRWRRLILTIVMFRETYCFVIEDRNMRWP